MPNDAVGRVIVKSGYADGNEAASGLTASEIREVLLKVKGIGEKKADAITDALAEALEQKLQAKDKNLVERTEKG